MKRLFKHSAFSTQHSVLLLLLLLLTFHLSLFTSLTWAAGNTDQRCEDDGDDGYVWIITFSADASAATIPSTTMSNDCIRDIRGTYLYQVDTDPASPAPTDDWDITISASGGSTDVMGSQCLNRDATNSETCYPLNYYLVDAPLTMGISGNLVNSATGTVKVFFVK